MKWINILLLFSLLILCCSVSSEAEGPAIHHTDNEKYSSVKIGIQEWMSENLNAGYFRNGDPIPEARTAEAWKEAGQNGRPAWCYYDNEPENGKIFGRLYNWYAVSDPRGLAPEGWRIPGDRDWQILVNALMGPEEAGGKLKEAGTAHWIEPNAGAVNSTGFTARPGGCRDIHGAVFRYIGDVAFFWSATESAAFTAWFWELYSSHSQVQRHFQNKQFGFSVRCVR